MIFFDYFRALATRSANGLSQLYILITRIPEMISFMNLRRVSVRMAVRSLAIMEQNMNQNLELNKKHPIMPLPNSGEESTHPPLEGNEQQQHHDCDQAGQTEIAPHDIDHDTGLERGHHQVRDEDCKL